MNRTLCWSGIYTDLVACTDIVYLAAIIYVSSGMPSLGFDHTKGKSLAVILALDNANKITASFSAVVCFFKNVKLKYIGLVIP